MRGVPGPHARIKRSMSNIEKIKQMCKEVGGKYYRDYEEDVGMCIVGDRAIIAGDFYVRVEEIGQGVIYEGVGILQDYEPDGRIVVKDLEQNEEIVI